MKHEEISQKAIIAVTNRQLCHGDFLQQIERLAASGVAAVILREKDLSTAAYLELAQQCQQRLQHTGTALLLNRTDAARQLGIREIQLSFPVFAQQREQLQDFCACTGVCAYCGRSDTGGAMGSPWYSCRTYLCY